MGGIGWIGKILVFLGIVFVICGILFLIADKIHFPRLPFDIYIKKNNLHIFIPIGTSLLLSFILTILLNLIIFLFFKK